MQKYTKILKLANDTRHAALQTMLRAMFLSKYSRGVTDFFCNFADKINTLAA